MKATIPLKVHPFIRNLLIAAIVLFICFSIPWAFVFWGHWAHVTSQDFANFGHYIGGVLTPTFTLVSAIVIGFQIVRTTENQKLERLIKDYRDALDNLSVHLENTEHLEVFRLMERVHKAWEKAVEASFSNPRASAYDYLTDEDTELLEESRSLRAAVSNVTLTLRLIEEIDPEQATVLMNALWIRIRTMTYVSLEGLSYYTQYVSESLSGPFLWLSDDTGKTVKCQRDDIIRRTIEAKRKMKTTTAAE